MYRNQEKYIYTKVTSFPSPLSMLFSPTPRHLPSAIRKFLPAHLINNFDTKRLSKFAPLAADMATVNTTERLKKLRDLMKENRIDVYSMIRK